MCIDVQEVNEYLLKQKKKFYKELGGKLRETRRKQNISINEIAFKTLISATYICQIERGEYGISLLKFIMICNCLAINPNNILKDFLIVNTYDEEIIIEKLQESKNISINVIDFMKSR